MFDQLRGRGLSRSDWLVPPAFAVAGLAETTLRELEPRTALLILAVVTPLPLFWRVRFPLETLVASVALLLVGEVIADRDHYPFALGCAALVATYSAAVHLRGRRGDLADLLVMAAIVASAAIGASKDSGGTVGTNLLVALVSLTVLFRGAWFAGRRTQQRRDRERAAIVEREQHAQAELRDERARIARELHDVVAHAMSVIVLQARGARHSLLERPDEAREAIEAVERAASQGLAEMRRLLGSLREDEATADLAPQPSLGELDGLFADIRSAGLPVELRVEGATREVPAGTSLCAYRIIQEALTNTLKHAGSAGAEVLVRYERDALEVEVSDTGNGDRTVASAAGQGLDGMRERVAILGGQLRTGPRRQGGYLVSARLPL